MVISITAKVLKVALSRDFYVLNSINNDLLVNEIKQGYGEADCVIKKRETLFVELLRTTKDLLNSNIISAFVIKFLTGLVHIFKNIFNTYLKTALEYECKSKLVYYTCVLLAQNEYYNYLEFCSIISSAIPTANVHLEFECSKNT